MHFSLPTQSLHTPPRLNQKQNPGAAIASTPIMMESSSASPLDLHSSDVLLLILAYAGPRTAAVFSGCSRASLHLVLEHDATLFKPPTVGRRHPFISSPLPAPVSGAAAVARNAAAAEAFKACLQLATWRDVWEATARFLALPCLGFFRHTSIGGPHGGLVHVTLDAERHALCAMKHIKGTDNGFSVACRLLRVARAPGLGLQLEDVSVEGAPDYGLRFLSTNDSDACLLFYRDPDIIMGVFPPMIFPDSVSEPPASWDRALGQLRGLWVGVYGPHGREVLHVLFNRLEDEEEDENGEEDGDGAEQAEAGEGGGSSSSSSSGQVVCEGSKITGDPNVPATEWSFRIDLGRPRDVRAALLADPRPIYASTAGTPIDHVILDLEEEVRVGRVYGLFPGLGQINRVPGYWDPESVGVDMVVFREREGSEVSRFGIVWHDDDHPVRHCILFHRFHSGTDEDVMWGGEYRFEP